MSDPAWASRTIISGADATLYVQSAGVTAAPGTAAEVAYVTDVSFEIAQQNTRKGPYLNLNRRKIADGGVEVSGEFTAELATGADTTYATLVNATNNRTRLKLTFVADSGPTFAVDQALVGFAFEGSGEDGYTTTFSVEADSLTYTAAV